jgi:hypothetical protein
MLHEVCAMVLKVGNELLDTCKKLSYITAYFNNYFINKKLVSKFLLHFCLKKYSDPTDQKVSQIDIGNRFQF